MSVPPNILWIVTTQWRAQACGYAGDRNARTPCLDAFASTAVNYAGAVTPHPFGPFARAALLTGRPSPQNGVREYFDPLPAGAPTIAHALRARGYRTGFFGKWHLARRDPAAPLVGEAHARTIVAPEARGGFEHWLGFEGGFLLNDPWLHGTGQPEPRRYAGYQPDVVFDQAARWMEQPGPWFCLASVEPPHPPYDALSGDVRPRDPSALELAANVPRRGEAEARARRELSGYYAHVEATDRAIGRLLERVGKRAGAVVVTSVHGDMHGSHGLFRKGWPYEESIRVPLLVREPDGGARVDRSPVSLLELGRLALAWAERRRWSPSADAAMISMPSVVALPHQCDRIWRGVRTAGRKLVLTGEGSPWLHFDLERDQDERHNLAEDPGAAEERRELISRYLA